MEDTAVTKFREYLRVNTEQPNPDYGKPKVFRLIMEDIAVTKFREYLRVNTEQPNPDYGKAKDQWKYDPYAAHKDENGDIYARGAQDMKCVGSQYFEAIRRHFMRGKKRWLRTIHIVWGPDEEIGAAEGMAVFCKMDEFRDLNIGFVLDEGLASETSEYKVYFAERCPWWLKVTCTGSPGHGSKFISNTAGEKLQKLINQTLEFREKQRKILEADPSKTLGDVTTLNLTIIEGGVQVNVLPEKFIAYFDIRVPPTVCFDEFTEEIANWCRNAGEGVEYEFLQVIYHISKCMNKEKSKKMAETSSRYYLLLNLYLQLGYRSIGFSPMNNTPSLLHDHNEYLNEKVYLRGVEIYETLIDNLASLKQQGFEG
ncbi:unnamed protein product [Strongylus vulgaris]|uniref:Peptidase M20 dimerisation domain-containing protein n=1 Tax=Strongylus vulgaris TaxID=40348 RepID=A0A3P7L7Q9_STRVU|nr:unnamed protein product [Strongylus vulgaris]